MRYNRKHHLTLCSVFTFKRWTYTTECTRHKMAKNGLGKICVHYWNIIFKSYFINWINLNAIKTPKNVALRYIQWHWCFNRNRQKDSTHSWPLGSCGWNPLQRNINFLILTTRHRSRHFYSSYKCFIKSRNNSTLLLSLPLTRWCIIAITYSSTFSPLSQFSHPFLQIPLQITCHMEWCW